VTIPVPLACSLTPDAYADRLRSIGELNRDFLRSYDRRDSTLELLYSPVASRMVRELVRREEICCAFLTFTLVESPDSVWLRVTAPQHAASGVDALFAPFLESAPGLG
jgi:hypothetical protein